MSDSNIFSNAKHWLNTLVNYSFGKCISPNKTYKLGTPKKAIFVNYDDEIKSIFTIGTIDRKSVV